MTDPTVSVVIPYRERGVWEHRLFDWTARRWATLYPVVVGDCGDPFNRSCARNDGAAKSTGDVLIFANGDTVWQDPEAITAAVKLAAEGQWSLPRLFVETREPQAVALLDGDPAAPFAIPDDPERLRDNSPAGPQIIRRDQFTAAGGWDEGFTAWGWEDTAFRAVVDTLVGAHVKVGVAVHLWHPRPADSVGGNRGFAASRARYQHYRRAQHVGPAAMRRLIKKRRTLR